MHKNKFEILYLSDDETTISDLTDEETINDESLYYILDIYCWYYNNIQYRTYDIPESNPQPYKKRILELNIDNLCF